MAGQDVVEFTDQNFSSEVLQSDVPVLVDFWAPWCGPCKMISPTIDELASEYSGRVRVGKMNVDNNQQVPSDLGVNQIPTVIVFKGGAPVERFLGITKKDRMARALDAHL